MGKLCSRVAQSTLAVCFFVCAPFGFSTSVSAAEPCPTEASKERYGPFEVLRVNEWYYTEITNLQPCEILFVEFSVTSPFAASFSVDLIGGTGVPFTTGTSVRCEGSCTFWVPSGNPYSGGGWMSTAGDAGRIKAVSVMMIDVTIVDAIPRYTLTIHKVSRPGFNNGGVGFSSALPISSRSKAEFMNLVAQEDGQYFSVRLGAGDTLRLSGIATTTQEAGTRLRVDIHDQTLARVTPERHVAVVAGETRFELPVFTNTSRTSQVFYLRARIDVGLVQLLVLYVRAD